MSDLTPAEAAKRQEVQEATEKLRNLKYEGLGWWRTQAGEQLSLEDVNEQRAVLAEAYLAEHPEGEPQPVWTDEQVFQLNANQHRGDIHPYTCGNDSRHRPLIATRYGWRCADCNYRQDWAHGINK